MMKKILAIICTFNLITALPTFCMNSDTNTTQTTVKWCDCCAKNIPYKDPIKNNHSIYKRSDGTCSYTLCDTCQAEITEVVKNADKVSQRIYENCPICFYFDAFALKLQWNPITYPCDNCHQEKSKLEIIARDNDDKTQCCLHILCEECCDTIDSWEKTTNNKILSRCKECFYFYDQHKKQCWQPSNGESKNVGGTERSSDLRRKYPNRILPDINPEPTQTNQNSPTINPVQANKDNSQIVDTYPCENCHEEQTILFHVKESWDLTENRLRCEHIVCQQCHIAINENWKKTQDDPIWWNCLLCSHFYHTHNQQCWQANQTPGWDYTSKINARGIKKFCSNRILPEINPDTIMPQKHNTAPKQLHRNRNNNPTQPEQNPTPNKPTSIVINRLKWLGITGVACYCAYKAYTWWKGEDTQDENTDDEQSREENKKREEPITGQI